MLDSYSNHARADERASKQSGLEIITTTKIHITILAIICSNPLALISSTLDSHKREREQGQTYYTHPDKSPDHDHSPHQQSTHHQVHPRPTPAPHRPSCPCHRRHRSCRRRPVAAGGNRHHHSNHLVEGGILHNRLVEGILHIQPVAAGRTSVAEAGRKVPESHRMASESDPGLGNHRHRSHETKIRRAYAYPPHQRSCRGRTP